MWPATANGTSATWVIGGEVVPDTCVTGVFVRRSTVYAEELTRTHPDDRAYLAAETHAFLAYVLSHTTARVVNPVDDGGTYGEAALRPERWMQAAIESSVAVAPLRVRSAGGRHVPNQATSFEVVGEQVMGHASSPLAAAALKVCRCLGLCWAVACFDKSGRLSAITTTPAPSPAAAAALARILTRRRPA
ncbi:MAG: hypothetical protein P0111_18225 [Nitrospira sp.]|nr:hypothetical protein [Nitrospira sp.]